MDTDIDKIAMKLADAIADTLKKIESQSQFASYHKPILQLQKQVAHEHFAFRQSLGKRNQTKAKIHAKNILGLSQRFESLLTPRSPLKIFLDLGRK